METCVEAVTELHNSLRKTVKLFTQVSYSVCGCERAGSKKGKYCSKKDRKRMSGFCLPLVDIKHQIELEINIE